jgi:putative transposase
MEKYKITRDASIYFLTFTVINWLPVFISEEPCQIVFDSLNYCHREEHLRINAFVIMPTHMHIIAFDGDFNNSRLQETIIAARKFTGRELADYCDQKVPVIGRLLHNTKQTDRERQFWQQSRHPESILSQKYFQQKVNYIHDNPRRMGLVRSGTDWRYASASYWLCQPPGETDIQLTGIMW